MKLRSLISAVAGFAAAMIVAGGAWAGSGKNLVDTAEDAGQFTTLIAAVEAAGLEDTLKGDGPFTLFAPTDAAFAKLPEGTVESLLLPENKDQLVAILTYHMVPGKVMSSDIAGQKLNASTLQGGELTIDAIKGVKVNEASVIAADVEATNGVIHAIDTVVLPQ